MTTIYLIRHGQASANAPVYDQLSRTGYEQTRELGRYWAARQLPIDLIACGTLQRQKQSMQSFQEGLHSTGGRQDETSLTGKTACFPALDEIPESTWRALGSELRSSDPRLERHFQSWLQLRSSGSRRAGLFFSKITAAVLLYWLEGKHQPHIPSFADFHHKVLQILTEIRQFQEQQHIVLFSSGTPIALLCGQALGLKAAQSLALVRTIRNSSISILEMHRRQLQLVSLNCTPHLQQPAGITLV
ncbi:MAG: histidine phosphatase family protein [Leptospiraceae bacterium]|nr:histidine phosphatase family protein [Leptospiraceae bacterium]